MPDILDIQPADPAKPQIRSLIEAQSAHGNAHYPAESNHHLTTDDYLKQDIRLFAAWLGGKCVGIAALKTLNTNAAELKSMHVLPQARGTGVGAKLLDHVIGEAQRQGLSDLYLETGSRKASAAARKLYEKFEFVYCPPFGDYKEDVESVFMLRTLT